MQVVENRNLSRVAWPYLVGRMMYAIKSIPAVDWPGTPCNNVPRPFAHKKAPKNIIYGRKNWLWGVGKIEEHKSNSLFI